jgi:PPOX class probable F420-dependent enzyme
MPHWRKTLGGVALLFLGGIAMATGSRAASLSPATEGLLRSSSYIYVATQRKDGQQSTASPIWFMWDDGKIFFTTEPGSWKAKRIARGSPLTIHVGSSDGPKLIGKARQVTEPGLVDRMGKAYSDKYWIAWLGLFRPRSGRVTAGKTAAYLVDVEPQ